MNWNSQQKGFGSTQRENGFIWEDILLLSYLYVDDELGECVLETRSSKIYNGKYSTT